MKFNRRHCLKVYSKLNYIWNSRKMVGSKARARFEVGVSFWFNITLELFVSKIIIVCTVWVHFSFKQKGFLLYINFVCYPRRKWKLLISLSLVRDLWLQGTSDIHLTLYFLFFSPKTHLTLDKINLCADDGLLLNMARTCLFQSVVWALGNIERQPTILACWLIL